MQARRKFYQPETNLGKFANTLNHLDESTISKEGENFEGTKERLRHDQQMTHV